MTPKKQLNVKISPELYDKIGAIDQAKNEIVSTALRLYLDSESKPKDININQGAIIEIATLKTKLDSNEQIIQILKDQVKDLQNQNGFLINEFQRLNKMNEQLLLTESENQKKNSEQRKWWQLWKK